MSLCVPLYHCVCHCVTVCDIVSLSVTLYHCPCHCVTVCAIVSLCVTLRHCVCHCVTVCAIVSLCDIVSLCHRLCQIFGPGKKLGSLILFTMCLLIITSCVSLQLFCSIKDFHKFETFPQVRPLNFDMSPWIRGYLIDLRNVPQ